MNFKFGDWIEFYAAGTRRKRTGRFIRKIQYESGWISVLMGENKLVEVYKTEIIGRVPYQE